jgi:hydroxymethylpyrimidine pyrophosphatase-like HAD family hydrolase
MKQKAIICDIDGVLLDTSHIFERIEKAGLTGDEMWDFFNRHANDYDVEVDSRIVELLETFANQGFRIIFLTARSIEIEKQTRAKIELAIARFSESIFDFLLIMRPSRNTDSAEKMKESWLQLLRQKYNVMFAIDDDDKNCEMFAKNNLLVMKSLK